MANVIGSLLVELGINTASWTAGLTKAQNQAQLFGKSLSASFGNIGRSITGLIGQISPLGGTIGSVMSHAQTAISAVTTATASMGGGFAALAGPIGIGVGIFLALGAAVAATAVSLANQAEQIQNTSAITGLSNKEVQIYSRLAEEAGVSAQAMTLAIGRLNAQIQKQGENNQFIKVLKSMGGEVKQANGEMRPMNELLPEFADRLGRIEDPAKRSALGMAAFTVRGRAAIQVMEAAIRSGKSLEEQMKDIAASGLLLSERQLQEALVLDEKLDEADRRWEALKKKVKVAAVEYVFFPRGFSAPKPPEKAAKEDEARSAKLLEENNRLFEQVSLIKAGSQAKRDLQKAEKQLQDEIEAGAGKEALATVRKIQSLKEKIKQEEASIRVGRVALDTVLKFVSGLEAETAAQLRLASAIGKTAAEVVLQNAAEKGQESVGKIRASLLGDIAGKEKELENAGKARNAQRRKEIEDALNDLRRQVTALEAAEAHVISLEQAKATAGLSRAFEVSLVNEIERMEMQATSLEALADAYSKTGAEISAARIQEQMRGQNLALKIQGDLLAKMTAELGAADPRVIKAADNFERIRLSVEAYAVALKNLNLSQINEMLAEQERVTTLDVRAIELQTSALFLNAKAQREAAIQAQILNFQKANPAATAQQIERETVMIKKLSEANHAAAVAQLAVSLNRRKMYDDEISKLNEVITKHGENRSVQIAAAVAAQNALRALTEEESKVAIQAGTTREALHGLFNQIVLDGENLRVKVFASIRTSIEGLSGELAKFVITGKANFRSLFASLSESILKASFQKGIGSIAGFLGDKLGLPGLGVKGGKPDGSLGNPIYTRSADGVGGILGGAGGAGGGIATAIKEFKVDDKAGWASFASSKTTGEMGFMDKLKGILGNLFSSIGGFFSKLMGGIASFFSGLGGGGGGLLGSIVSVASSIFGAIGGGLGGGVKGGGGAGNFGGGRALGGDVTPGKAYLVGEKRPELFVPKQAGTIIPSLKSGDVRTTNLSVNFHGVTDMDTFKKNKAQLAAEFYGAASMAYARAR